MKKILITGASGFIGSFIVEEALKRGFETWAAVRKSSSRKYLNDSRIHFIELDLGNLDKLEKQLSGQQFDYVVHAAGVTKCLHSSDFFKVNTEGTANLALALRRQNTGLRRFVYLSSPARCRGLSASGSRRRPRSRNPPAGGSGARRRDWPRRRCNRYFPNSFQLS